MRNRARHCLEHNQRQCVADFEEGQQSLTSEYMNWNPYPNVSREREKNSVFDRRKRRRMCFIEKKNERSIDQRIHNTQPIRVYI